MNAENDIQISEGGSEASGAEMTELLSGGEVNFTSGETKKSGNAATMLLVGTLVLGAAGFYFMFVRGGPQPAGAATSPDSKAANEAISKFLGEGNQNVKAMEAMIKNTEKVVEQFLEYPAINQVPLEELKTNPFRDVNAKKSGGDLELAEKKRQEQERVAALKAVQALQLQTIMHGGANSACMINNALYQEGQQVDGFTVEKISPGAVVVRSGPYRFELKMQEQ